MIHRNRTHAPYIFTYKTGKWPFRKKLHIVGCLRCHEQSGPFTDKDDAVTEYVTVRVLGEGRKGCTNK